MALKARLVGCARIWKHWRNRSSYSHPPYLFIFWGRNDHHLCGVISGRSDLLGDAITNPAGTTVTTAMFAGLSLSASLPSAPTSAQSIADIDGVSTPQGHSLALSLRPTHFNMQTATAYLFAGATFTGSTETMSGNIYCCGGNANGTTQPKPQTGCNGWLTGRVLLHSLTAAGCGA